jgi:hypothetical protein
MVSQEINMAREIIGRKCILCITAFKKKYSGVVILTPSEERYNLSYKISSTFCYNFMNSIVRVPL